MKRTIVLAALVLTTARTVRAEANESEARQLSAAMKNVVDVRGALSAFADYTNNVLRIESALPSEWDGSNPRRIVDRFPASHPYQLVVGPDPADREMAEFARKVIARSMPDHIRGYLCRHKLLAPLEQWLIRRSHPSVTNEATYLSAAAHPSVWTAKDFDLIKLEKLAASLTSNSVPMLATLQPIYEEFKAAPIRRAEPLVDYPDPRPEETYATPMGHSIVLRAMESRRKFRFRAVGYPFRNASVNFAWVPVNGHAWIGGFPCGDPSQRKNYQPNRGFAEVTLGWWSQRRRDILVFARYGSGPYGPPSVISFFTVPNEQRRYDRDGRIESVEYKTDAFVIPQLYQNKPWKDSFVQDSLGNLIGFLRTRAGSFKEERFSDTGEFVCEVHAGDLPKTTKKVRYFTCSDDPTTLDYEVTDETAEHKLGSFVPRNRGEFPPTRPRRRR